MLRDTPAASQSRTASSERPNVALIGFYEQDVLAARYGDARGHGNASTLITLWNNTICA
jgi:hypothetical protein